MANIVGIGPARMAACRNEDPLDADYYCQGCNVMLMAPMAVVEMTWRFARSRHDMQVYWHEACWHAEVALARATWQRDASKLGISPWPQQGGADVAHG